MHEGVTPAGKGYKIPPPRVNTFLTVSVEKSEATIFPALSDPTRFVILENFRLRVGSLGALKRTKNWHRIFKLLYVFHMTPPLRC